MVDHFIAFSTVARHVVAILVLVRVDPHTVTVLAGKHALMVKVIVVRIVQTSHDGIHACCVILVEYLAWWTVHAQQVVMLVHATRHAPRVSHLLGTSRALPLVRVPVVAHHAVKTSIVMRIVVWSSFTVFDRLDTRLLAGAWEVDSTALSASVWSVALGTMVDVGTALHTLVSDLVKEGVCVTFWTNIFVA